MKILAIDPGVTTGYCFAEFKRTEEIGPVFNSPQGLTLDPQQHVDDVEEAWDRIEAFAPRYIICEDFEFRGRTRTGLVLFSVQLIGVARLYEAIAFRKGRQCATVLQKAAQGKSYYTDTMLKQVGAYSKNIKHGNDATRHLLHWLTFGEGYQYIEGRDIKDLVRLK